MNDEDTKTPEVKVPEVKVPEAVSIVDEARAIRDEIVKAKEDLKIENDRKDKLHADELLSSSAGARPAEVQEKKEETPKEYNERIDKELSEGKHDE